MKRRITVKKKGISTRQWTVLILLCGLLFSFNIIYGQLEDLEELGTEEVKCIPDSFTTIYDKYKQDNVDPQQIGIWYSLAREEYKYKNYKRALPYFWKVLVHDNTGKFRVVYSRLADCYFNLNFPDSVLLVVYRGLDAFPDNNNLHYWGGIVHERLNHIKCAIPHYEAMAEADPQNKSYWDKLTRFYLSIEDKKAIAAQQKVVQLDPQNAEASRMLAQLMEHFGEDPIEAQKQAYLRDKTNINNAINYAKTLFERGEYKEATAPFLSAHNQDKKNIVALEYLGRCSEGLNQLNKSLDYYKQILDVNPQNLNVLCLTASVYSRLNNFTTGRTYVNRAIRVDAESGLPYMIMAEIYENAVQYCSEKRGDRKLTYDDKLVYKFAQDALRKAAKDPEYAQQAERRINALNTLVPSKEDLFMQKNRMQTREPCYNWIQ
jgi:tetratricopeptide (TPR) repeat protein